MKNRFCKTGWKAVLVFLQQAFLLAMISIMLFMYIGTNIYTDYNRYQVHIDPLDEADSFVESNVFHGIYYNDLDNLLRYLAVCEQFENGMVYDEEKTIDLLQYYNRRNVNANQITSNGELEYKVKDLMNWRTMYGLNTHNGLLEEAYLPVDGVSIYDKDIVSLFENNNLVEYNWESNYEQDYLNNYFPNEQIGTVEELSEYYMDYWDEYGNKYRMDPNGMRYYEEDFERHNQEVQSYFGITQNHTYTPDYEETNVESELGDFRLSDSAVTSYKETNAETEKTEAADGENVVENERLSQSQIREKLLDEKTYYCYQKLFEYINVAAEDLTYNYENYMSYQDYYNAGSNFKYLYIPDVSGERYYTNLEMGQGESVQEKAKYFSQLAKYAECDLGSFNLVGDEQSTSTIRNFLSNYAYAFRSGGKLYIGYINETISGFAGHNASDGYGIAEAKWKGYRENFFIALYWAAACALLYIISFILLIVLSGRKTIAGQEQEVRILNAFDKWHTEIALVAGAVCQIGVLTLALFAMDRFGGNLVATDSNTMIFRFSIIFILFSVLLCHAVFQFNFFSFIRRIKAHVLWERSILRKIVIYLKHVLGLAVKNAPVIVLTWVPYGLLLLVNAILLLWAGTSGIVSPIVIAMLFDIVVGLILLKYSGERAEIVKGIERISNGDSQFRLDTGKLYGENKKMAEAVNSIGNGIRMAVETSMKDERLKTDLITNVSHDIKTPLTSIISYVDLLKRENIADEKIAGYIEVLDAKSQRLKQLTEDLVEASKITSGNITLQLEEFNVVELLNQAVGEFSEKFEQKKLQVITNYAEPPVLAHADSSRTWRVIDNLFGNVYKYAMDGTRVYVDVANEETKVIISIKNISAQPLNIDAKELTERFIRGDIARSSEGSGLGLSIAQSLVHAQDGNFMIYLDGDLFKVIVELPKKL